MYNITASNACIFDSNNEIYNVSWPPYNVLDLSSGKHLVPSFCTKNQSNVLVVALYVDLTPSTFNVVKKFVCMFVS